MQHKLIYGAGDLLEMIDDMRARVVKGEVDAVSVSFVGANGHLFAGTAWKDDMAAPWAKIFSGVSTLWYDLLANGLGKNNER